jgi:transcriptional regulator with PAS, ATPase and Fis domain
MSMTTNRSIIHNARDAIGCVSATGIIDSVNHSVTDVLRFIPEQLLGENLKGMVSEMIARRGRPKQFREQFQFVNEELTCLVNILGMTQSDAKSVESFVVMIKDLSSLIEQQDEAELAKEKSDRVVGRNFAEGHSE